MAAKKKPPAPKAVYKAINADDVEALRKALAAGFDVDTQFDPATYGARTPLSYAVNREAYGCAKVLIAAGANVNLHDTRGGTAIVYASTPAIIDALVAAGAADLSARDDVGCTALHRAAEISNRPWVERLLHHGADASADNDGERPADLCTDPSLLALLAKHGGGRSPAKPPEVLAVTRSTISWSELLLREGTIAVDREGIVWLAGHLGLYRFDGKRLELFDFGDHHVGSIERIVTSSTGAVYCACTTGVLRIVDDVVTCFTVKQGLIDDSIVDADVDADGRLYFLMSGDTFPVAMLDGDELTPIDTPAHEFAHLAVLADGRLALASHDQLSIRTGKKWSTKTELAGFALESVWSIAADGTTLYLATGDGLVELRANGKAKLLALPAMPMTVFAEGDEIYAGVDYVGIARVGGRHWDATTLPSGHVHSIARAPDGTIWLCAGDYVARIVDGEVEAMSRPQPKKQRAKS